MGYLIRRAYLLFIFLLPFFNVKGQVNHVLNYSFEKYSNCAQIGNCSGSAITNWYNPTITYVSWFSYPCYGSSGSCGVPQNAAGYQNARTGRCYSGIEISEAPTRTYITGIFSDSLIATKKYCITFYVNLGDSIWWAVSAFGAYISDDSVCEHTFYDTVLHYIPQIENPSSNILVNKINWTPISGEYVANGGEKFITIGDFYSDTLSHFTYVGNGGFVAGWNTAVQTYYFLDDVYVRELTIAVAGKADTICAGDSVLIGKDTLTPGVSYHWLPTAGLSNPNIPQPKASPTTTTTYTLTVTNDSILAINNRGQKCNCADSVTKDSITISVCSGINELSYKNRRISINPNPSNGQFTLSVSNINEKCDVVIYNVLGQKVNFGMLKQVQHDHEIDMSDQPHGIYFYRVITESGKLVGSGKIILE